MNSLGGVLYTSVESVVNHVTENFFLLSLVCVSLIVQF